MMYNSDRNEVFKMKTALILAGGLAQGDLAAKLRARGYYTIMADYTPSPVGKSFADKFYCVSTLDIDAIRNIVISEKVDMIITVCTDQAMVTVSRLSEELRLPCYIDAKTGLMMTNKAKMKVKFKDNKIPTSEFVIIDNEDGFGDAVSNIEYPMVVKPVDCNSSKGVRKVYDDCELENAVKDAKALSRQGKVIVEKFIKGRELSCDYFVVEGKAVLLSVSQSYKVKSDEKFVISSSNYPAECVNEDIKNRILNIGQRIVDSYQLKNCPMLVQMLYCNDELYVIEFSARTGGCIKHKLIENISGVDVIEKTIDITENKISEIGSLNGKYKDKYIRNQFIYCKSGVFDHVNGFEELKKQGLLDEYYILHSKGKKMGGASSSGDRIAAYTVVADTMEKLKKKQSVINENIRVLDENNRDIIDRDILMGEEI